MSFEGDANEAAEELSRQLQRVTTTPWFGVAAETLLEPLNAALVAKGVALRATPRQREQWWDMVVGEDDIRLTRSCIVYPTANPQERKRGGPQTRPRAS